MDLWLIFVLGIVGFFVLFALYVRLNYRKPTFPRHYVDIKRGEPLAHECTRDNFSKKKIPEQVDAIIIGSGMGGLMCAGLFAKLGKRVLVLEQHYVAGGSTHSFEDKGWEFDTGLHYVGRVEKYGKLLDVVGDNKVEWKQMGTKEDGFTYDEVVVGRGEEEIKFSYKTGKQPLIDSLIEKFPHEKEAIIKYIDLVEKVNKISGTAFELKLLPKFLVNLFGGFMTREFREMASKTPVEVVESMFKDKKLKAILLAQFGDYGGSPDQASFMIQAGVSSHYFSGAYYPVGGPASIARSIIPTIERAGGRVLVRAQVEKILIDEKSNTAYGVIVEKGQTEIRAPLIVSAAGAMATCKMIDQNILAKMELGTVPKELKQSMCHIIAFVGLRGSPEELGVRSSNIWHLPCDDDFDLSKMCHDYYADPTSANPIVFIGFPSAKDPDFQRRFPGKTTCCIVSEARYEWFEEYKAERVRHRSAPYQDLKEQFTGRLLEGLFHHYPNLKDKIEYIDLSTPLSSEYYLASPQGSSYGLEHSPKRYTKIGFLRPQTEVNNLYLTGQDVATAGIVGALMSGILTAMAATGYPTLMDALTKRNIIEDLMYVDKLKAKKQD